MIALDASVLIAHLDPSDPHHPAATAIFLGTSPGSTLVHPLTMAEVLIGGVWVRRGVAMRDDLLAAGVAVVPYDADGPMRLAELRVETRLKLPDCCVLDVAIHRRTALATFDAALAAAAHRRGVTVVR